MRIGTNSFNENFLGEMKLIQVYDELLDATAVANLQVDINGYSSGKVLDLNSTKSSTTWTDDASSDDGTVDSGVIFRTY